MAAPTDARITRILDAAADGDSNVAAELLPLVYEELRRLAHAQMARERPGQTLQPTALVHEAYLCLVGGDERRWGNRAHFFAAAARAMRQILVNRSHRRRAAKHGGDRVRVDLDQVELAGRQESADRIVALDEALDRLEQIDPRKARIVSLRYFAGLTIEQTAKAVDLSPATVKREWQFARTWLYRGMTIDDEPKA